MDLKKWKRFKRSGNYRRKVAMKLQKLQLVSESGSTSSFEMIDSNKVCDGSVQQETISDHFLQYGPDFISENSTSDEDFDDDDDNNQSDLEKTYELKEDIKQWALKNNISHSALNELSLIINKRINYALPKDARTLLKTNNKEIKMLNVGTGQYWHNGLKEQIMNVLEKIEKIPCVLSLNINIDGLPIYNSSRHQFWPILCSIFEMPKLSPLIVGIYAGTTKPTDLNDYLDPVVAEIIELESGLKIKTNTVAVKIRAFVCDSPARALIKGVANFNSKHGCLKCTVVGDYSHVSHTVTFLKYDCPKRNDKDFREKQYGAHHKQDSPLLQLKIDMIEDFPVADSLHLIDLGLMKRLLLGWREGNFGKYLTKWSARDIEKINEFLSHCKLPAEIHRSVRTIDVLAHWKGSEYRSFLYYLSIIILKYVLNSDAYIHFLHLFCAITICSNESHFQFLRIAEKMLEQFIENFKVFYGKDYITSNIHNLIHVVEEVRKFGTLQTFNAYPFENKLFSIKRMIRHGNKPLQQVARRLNERLDAEIEIFCEHQQTEYPFVKLCNRKGGVKHVLHFESFVLSTKTEDKWFLSDQDHIVEVYSIILKNEDEKKPILLNGHRILNLENVFEDPIKSSFLRIFKCELNNINKIEATYDVSNVKCKLVCIEYYSELFFIPLLHTL